MKKLIYKNTILKIKDFVFNARHKQRRTSHATTSVRRTHSKPPSLNPQKKAKKFGFRSQFKDFLSPLNLVALLLMDVGIAFLIWVGNVLWTDLTVLGKDVTMVLFGSRAGEAISLGIGMAVIHYLVIGAFLFSTSILLMKSQRVFGLIGKMDKISECLSTFSAPIKSRKTRELSVRGTPKRRKMLVFAIFVLTAFTLINAFLLNSIIGQTATKSSLQSYGSIRTVGVGIYSNGYCVETVSVVDWGMITPGQAITRTFYLRNEGNNDVTLSMLTTNWTPPAVEDYMALTWDYEEGQLLEPDQIIAVTFTLSVDSAINGIETFSFGIEIIGAG